MAKGERAEIAREKAAIARERVAEVTEELTERAKRFGETAINTPANIVTGLRLLFTIPVLVWILDEHDATWTTFTGWMVLWVTDGLDGWLARRDGTTRSGAFLDPLADKVLVLGGFFALAIRGDFAWLAGRDRRRSRGVHLRLPTFESRRGRHRCRPACSASGRRTSSSSRWRSSCAR